MGELPPKTPTQSSNPDTKLMVHELKTDHVPFRAIWNGTKTLEIRINDRAYRVGDVLHLKEWHPSVKKHMRSNILAKVTHILEGGQYGILSGYVAMSIEVIMKSNDNITR